MASTISSIIGTVQHRSIVCNELSPKQMYAEHYEVGGVDSHMLTTVLSIDICGSDSQSSSQNSNSTSSSGTNRSDCSLSAGAEVTLLQKLKTIA